MFDRTPPGPLLPTVGNTIGVTTRGSGRYPKKIDHSHQEGEREFVIDNLLVRVHLIIEMNLVDRPCAMGVRIPLSE
jgi:hypothetical protein